MARRQALEVGIRVGAVDDGASRTIRGIAAEANATMKNLVGGLAGMGAGYAAKRMAMDITNEYGNQENALAKVRIMTMKVGQTNDELYKKQVKYIEDLGQRYPGTVEDYAKMQATLLRYRLTPQDIMGGVGETSAKLAAIFETDPAKGAAFFAKMKNDFHVQVEDMDRLANMLMKVHHMGVGIDGADAINEMTQAFSKEGLAVRNLGMQGAKAAEDLGLLSAMFINTGMSGQSVGTNLRRILEGAVNPDKAAKVRARGRQLGMDINFLDEKGNFAGIDNFVTQLSKLKNLSSAEIYHVLDPLAGKQGMSTSMDAFIAKFGEVEFTHYKKFKDELINIDDAIKQLELTQNWKVDVMADSFKNLKAALGGTLNEDVNRLAESMANSANSLRDFTRENPALVRVTLELGLAGAAAAGLYGSLLTVGNYIPVLGRLANGLAASFGWVGTLAALLMIVKEGEKTADKKAEEAGAGSMYSRNIGFINKKMEETQQYEGVLPRMYEAFWWFKKGANSLMYSAVGEKWYNRLEENMAPTKEEWEYDHTHFMGLPSRPTFRGSENWEKMGRYNYYQPAGGGVSINYSPTITADGLDTTAINNLLQKNSKELMEALSREMNRNKNLTYGKSGGY